MRRWLRRLWHRLTCAGYIDTINYAELCRHPDHIDGQAAPGNWRHDE